MNTFSHAVTGVARDIIDGKFQEMMVEERIWDAMALLKYMDNTSAKGTRGKQSDYFSILLSNLGAKLFHLSCRDFNEYSLEIQTHREVILTEMHQLINSLNTTINNYLVGRTQPGSFQELIDFCIKLVHRLKKLD